MAEMYTTTNRTNATSIITTTSTVFEDTTTEYNEDTTTEYNRYPHIENETAAAMVSGTRSQTGLHLAVVATGVIMHA